MNIQQIIMTPEIARDLLTKNNNNRKIRRGLVVKLCQDIKDGQWHLTHQPVAIDSNGTVLDGQHRLTAIVEAGIAVPLMLATGCQPETMIAVDTGNTRTIGDVMTIKGTKNATAKAAIMRLYKSYFDQPEYMWSGRNVYSVQTIEDAVQKIDNFDDVLNIAKKATREFKLLTTSAVGAFMLLGMEAGYSLDSIEAFLYKLSTGDQVALTDPIYAYRQYLINSTKSKYVHGKRTQRLIADFIKLFNLTIAKAELRKYHPPTLPPMPKFL